MVNGLKSDKATGRRGDKAKGKEKGSRRKEEGGRRKEEGSRRKEAGGRKQEEGATRRGGEGAEGRGGEGEKERVTGCGLRGRDRYVTTVRRLPGRSDIYGQNHGFSGIRRGDRRRAL